MLDNGSRDGSVEAAREHPAVDETIAVGNGAGKGLNDSEPLRRARGQFALPLQRGLRAAAGGDARALRGAAEAARRSVRGRRAAPALRLAAPAGGSAQASAWRFPTPLTALAGALLLHRRLVVQSLGTSTREVDWCQSAALLVRTKAAAQVGYLDPAFFVYSDEVDFARRLRDADWRSLWVPAAVAVHHEQALHRHDPRATDRRNGAQPRTYTCASITPPPRPARCAG